MLLVFVYTLAAVRDWISALVFTFVLLEFAGLVSRRWMFAIIELILLADLGFKSPYFRINADKFRIDKHIVDMIF